ncbi:Der GTPase-activating protein YihI [Vibrio hannami]|uniref:Der GTPase-activating protein YihI n=1 Tax=Vibrio hannami TaxID=2717094 RepID=UPI00241001F5|nr:Der GTPase-activating protein YihI [Vibrio hannami]MDG3086830.1 Der GTPase-activating protein YihI [Vibrio hannami]
MSRKKKSRKPGSTGDVDLIVTRNRSEADVEGRLRKKMKKRKGLKTGNRNAESVATKERKASQAKDPRIGSKKKIPLIVEAKPKQTKKERRISAEKELEMLENDAQLNVLLDRIDNGEKLGAGLQKYVDEKLDRIEVLMNQLGLIEPEEMEEPAEEIEPVKAAKPKKASSDDDLLSQFEDLDLNDFKS